MLLRLAQKVQYSLGLNNVRVREIFLPTLTLLIASFSDIKYQTLKWCDGPKL